MLFSGFILGLISSLHCIGMCGPIAMMLPVDHKNPAKKTVQLLVYHLGRCTAYMTLGLVFGLLGKGLFLAGFQQQLSIVIGILMIGFVLTPEKIFAQYNFSKPVYKLISRVKILLGSKFKNKSFQSLFTIGLLNGYLPCGLVYVALFGAIAMQNAILGITYMLLYGLGTIPMMSMVVYFTDFLSTAARSKIQKIIPFVSVFIGFLFIIRGLGLDIPFLSPSNTSLYIQSESACKSQ